MSKLKSFKNSDLEYKHHNISDTRDLQAFLSNISSDNIDESYDLVIPFLQNDISAHQFFISLKNIIMYRPLLLHYYCQLLSRISNEIKSISSQQFQRKIIVMFKHEFKLLLTLYELGIIDIENIIDNSLCPFESNQNLKKYFYPEIVKSQPNYFIKYRKYKDMFLFLTLNLDGSTDHIEKRNKGMNENIICQYIINDDFDNFIKYINMNVIDLNSLIPFSLFESSGFVSTFSEKGMHYIEYAAFYGALKIFKYLIQINCVIQPKTMNAAIIGGNYEIIHLLEDKNISMNNDCLYDAVKSNRNEIVNYILDNNSSISLSEDILNDLIPFYNLDFIINTAEFLVSDAYNKNESKTFLNSALFVSCENDFPDVVDFLLSFKEFSNVNYKYNLFYDMTLLHKATLSHKIEMIKVLLNKKGINPSITDSKISNFCCMAFHLF